MTLCHPFRIKLVQECKWLYGVKPLRLREKRGRQYTSVSADKVRSAKDGSWGIRRWREISLARGSIPIRENLVGLGDVLFRAGEVECQFSGLARDLHGDGVEAIAFHACVELFVGFPGAVFVEAVSHDQGSVRCTTKAMLNGGYFAAVNQPS
jgi:hypothetical protein